MSKNYKIALGLYIFYCVLVVAWPVNVYFYLKDGSNLWFWILVPHTAVFAYALARFFRTVYFGVILNHLEYEACDRFYKQIEGMQINLSKWDKEKLAGYIMANNFVLFYIEGLKYRMTEEDLRTGDPFAEIWEAIDIWVEKQKDLSVLAAEGVRMRMTEIQPLIETYGRELQKKRNQAL